MDSPIFFIGVPRSGTSFIYEIFSKHEDLGWISNYQNRLWKIPQVTLLNRLFDNALVYKMGSRKDSNKMTNFRIDYPKPTEPYIVWDALSGIDFSMDFLLHQKANSGAKKRIQSFYSKVLKNHNKKRIVNKFTGPSRIEYIQSVFPNAKFIHIVRDSRAVVQSLLDVDFWKNGGGYEKLWWQNGKETEALKYWKKDFDKPYMLTAYQIRNILEKTEQERTLLSNENFMEIRFEEFLKTPIEHLVLLNNFCGLNQSVRSNNYISISKKNPNDKYKSRFTPEEITELNAVLEPVLTFYNYQIKQA